MKKPNQNCLKSSTLGFLTLGFRKSPSGVVVDVLDCSLKVSEFKLQSCYYVYFRTNILEKGMNSFIPLSYMLNSSKSWRQHPTKQQLYGNLPPITKTIQVRWTRHVEHCWRSRDELISDILLWTPSHGRAKAEDDQQEPT